MTSAAQHKRRRRQPTRAVRRTSRVLTKTASCPRLGWTCSRPDLRLDDPPRHCRGVVRDRGRMVKVDYPTASFPDALFLGTRRFAQIQKPQGLGTLRERERCTPCFASHPMDERVVSHRCEHACAAGASQPRTAAVWSHTPFLTTLAVMHFSNTLTGPSCALYAHHHERLCPFGNSGIHLVCV